MYFSYMYICISLFLSLYLFLYIFIHCTHTHTCSQKISDSKRESVRTRTFVCARGSARQIERASERERERQTQREIDKARHRLRWGETEHAFVHARARCERIPKHVYVSWLGRIEQEVITTATGARNQPTFCRL